MKSEFTMKPVRKVLAILLSLTLLTGTGGGWPIPSQAFASEATETDAATVLPAATDATAATDAPAATDATAATDAPTATDTPVVTDVPAATVVTDAADTAQTAEPSAESATIQQAIALAGYAYVTLDDHEAGVYSGSGMKDSQRFGVLHGRGTVLLATEYLPRGERSAAVQVWFANGDGVTHGYVSQARLSATVIAEAAVLDAIAVSGRSSVVWRYGDVDVTLSDATLKEPKKAEAKATPTDAPEQTAEPAATQTDAAADAAEATGTPAADLSVTQSENPAEATVAPTDGAPAAGDEQSPTPTESAQLPTQAPLYRAAVTLNNQPQLRLRKEMTQDSDINGYAANGAVVSVLSEADEWAWARTDEGVEGYVRLKYLTKIETIAETPAPATEATAEPTAEPVPEAVAEPTPELPAADATEDPFLTVQPDPTEEATEEALPEDAAALAGMDMLGDDIGTFGAGDSAPAISLTLYPTKTGVYEYYTYETVALKVAVDMSAVSTVLSNPVLTITMPNTYLDSVTASDITGATKSISVDPSSHLTTITYRFTQLSGGTTIEVPFTETTVRYQTPDNYALPVNAVLTDSDGMVLKTADTMNINHNVKPIALYKAISAGDGMTIADNSVVYGGLADASDSTLISATGTAPVYFGYSVFFTNGGNNVGERYLQEITITDTVPQEAVFDPAANPGWAYDAETRIATYVYHPTVYVGSNLSWDTSNIKMKLTFPGAKVQTPYVNTASVHATPYDAQNYEDDFSATDSITFILSNQVTGPSLDKRVDQNSSNVIDQTAKKTYGTDWSLWYRNPSLVYAFENLSIEDRVADSRLQITKVRFGTSAYPSGSQITIPETGEAGYFSVEAEAADGTVTVVASHVQANSVANGFEYAMPAGTAAVRFKTDPGSALISAQTFVMGLNTNFIDPINTHCTGNAANDRFRNNATASGNYVGISQTFTATDSDFGQLVAYSPQASVFKGFNQYTAYLNDVVGCTIGFRGETYGNHVMFAPDKVELQRLIDLLPLGMAYVQGSAYNPGSGFGNNTNTDGQKIVTNLQPAVVDNYKGTGRTALIWDVANPLIGGEDIAYINFNVKITRDMVDGVNTNEAYAIWRNNGSGGSTEITVPPTDARKAQDTMDIDDDGNTAEMISKATSTITYNAVRELYGSKYVKGDLDSAYLLNTGTTLPGGAASYKLTVTNRAIENATALTLLDVLPRVGDQAIVADSAGAYLARGSEIGVYLTGAVTVPTGYSVYYKTDGPAGSAGQYANDSGWTSVVSDFGTVTGIKIVMNAGVSIAQNESVSFTLPVKVDGSATVATQKVAVNSFALSVDGNTFFEATNRKLRVIRYTVSGIAFSDGNTNSTFDAAFAGDHKLPNIPVWLEDENGNPVKDPDGNVISATTDADGIYLMQAYQAGKYRVRFEMPSADYALENAGSGTDPLASHIGPTQLRTDVFTLSPQESNAVRNAGFVYAYGDLQLEKIVNNVNGVVNSDKSTFTFTLSLDGNPYNGQATINGTEQTITNGALSFQNGDTVIISQLQKGTLVTAAEADAGGYIVSTMVDDVYSTKANGATRELTLKNSLTKIAWTNTEPADAALTVTKVVKDATGNVITTPMDFSITVTGPSYPYGSAFTLTNGTPLALSNLMYGTYSVTENGAALDDYNVTVSDDVTLGPSAKTGQITVTNQRKPPIDASVSGTVFFDANENSLYDEGSADETLFANVPVQLYNSSYIAVTDDEGNPVTTVTDENGHFTLPITKAGSYFVHFTLPEGYFPTAKGDDDAVLASHIYGSGDSSPFTITDTVTTAIRNAGLTGAYATLTFNKTIRTADGKVLTDKRTFTFEVYLSGGSIVTVNGTDVTSEFEDMGFGMHGLLTIQNGDEVIFSNVSKAGMCYIMEQPAADYDVFTSQNGGSERPGSFFYPMGGIATGTVTFINQERADGELTVTKNLLDEGGNALADATPFTVRVTGPSYPSGETMTLINGTPLVLSDLMHGEYTVAEVGASGYLATVSGAATLSAEQKTGAITVTNRKRSAMPALSISKSTAQTAVRAGGTLTYQVVVSNAGEGEGANVQVEERLPENASLISATPTAGTYDPSSNVWKIDTLASGGSATLTVVVQVADDAKNGDTVVNTAQISAEGGSTLTEPIPSGIVETPVEAPVLSLRKTADVTQTRSGEDIVFTVTLQNTGNVDATDVLVSELLPANAVLKSATPSAGTFDMGTGVWTIETLAAKATATLIAVVTTAAGAADGDQVINTVTVTSLDGTPLEDGPTADAAVPVRQPVLSIEKSTAATQVRAGEDIPYTVTVTNRGSGTAKAVEVTETAPSNTVFRSATATQGSYTSGTAVWSVGDVASGSSATLTLVCTVSENAKDGDSVVNTASVTKESGTAPTDAITDTVTTPVRMPVLTIAKTTTASTARAGEDIPYTVTVTNTGTGTAYSVKVTETLPANAVYQSHSTASGSYSDVTGVWSIGDIAPGGSAVLTLLLRVASTALDGDTVRNVATVTEENGVTRTAPDAETATPVQNPLLSITKTANHMQVRAGENITYTIVLTNSGNATAKAVQVTEALPADTTFQGATATSGTYNATTGLWSVGNVAANASATLTLILGTQDDLPDGTVVHNAVSVTEENGTAPTSTISDDADTAINSPHIVVTKNADSTQVRAGEEISYTITATNQGAEAATAVKITDTLPTNATYQRHTAAVGTYNASTGVWSVGDMAAGATATLRLVLKVASTAAEGDTVYNVVTVSEENGAQPTHPSGDDAETPVHNPQLTIAKTTAQTQVRAGADIAYTIVVRNSGLSEATAVKVMESLPSNAAYKNASATNGSYSAASGIWQIDRIPAGGSATLTLVLTASASAADGDTVLNTAYVAEENGLPFADPPTSEAETPVQNPALAITKNASQAQVRAGEDMTFTITLRNTGLGTALNVKVAETLPQNTVFKSASSANGTYDSVNHIWNAGDLAPGGSAVLTVVLTATGDVYDGDVIRNLATVTHENNQSLTDPPVATAEVAVKSPVLTITKTAAQADVRPGGDITYTVTVSNTGSAQAKNVKVTETLPVNTAFKSATPTSGTFDPATKVWSAGDLNAGASTTLTIVVTVSGAARNSDTITNLATVTQENGVTLTAPEAQAQTTVKAPVLAITKTSASTQTRAGDDITYTVRVSNTGLAAAKDVKVTESLPANATFKSASTASGTYSAATNLWSAGDIAAGGSATLTIVLTVSSTAQSGDTVVNTATLTEENGVTLPTPPTGTVSTPVENPNLSITKTASATAAQPGMDITYTIQVSNSGRGPARAVVVTEALPATLAFKSASTANGSYSSSTSLWTVGDIAAGGSATLLLTATVQAGVKEGDTVSNAVTVSTESGAPLPVPVSATATVPVRLNGQLTVTKILQAYNGAALTSIRTFVIRVTGPSYPHGQLFELSNSAPTVLTGLLYGKYTVEELNATGYNTSITPPVTISASTPQAAITVTNREKDKATLPVTGENDTWIVLSGAALAILGALLLLMTRRRRKAR